MRNLEEFQALVREIQKRLTVGPHLCPDPAQDLVRSHVLEEALIVVADGGLENCQTSRRHNEVVDGGDGS